MATFPSIEPLYNTQETVKQDYITVKLGDGYQQILLILFLIPSLMQVKNLLNLQDLIISTLVKNLSVSDATQLFLF